MMVVKDRIWRSLAVASMLVALWTSIPPTAATGDEHSNRVTQVPYFAEVRLHGGKFGHEFCSGVLLRPDVVLTTAHCAANTELDSVNITLPKNEAAVAQVLDKQTRTHPSFGAKYPFANNAALLFLNLSEQQDQSSLWPLVSLPSSNASPAAAVPPFQEMRVLAQGAALSPATNLSRDSCAAYPNFANDTSVWCSFVAKETSSNTEDPSSSSGECASSSVGTALGSPIVVKTEDPNSSSGFTVVGLRLTRNCADPQAFVFIPDVLDFILPHLQPSSPVLGSNLTLGFEATDARNSDISAGKVSPGEMTLSSLSSSASSMDGVLSADTSGSAEQLGEEDDPSKQNASFIGGWLSLPSLGEFSGHAAFLTQNTTEESGELQACLGILIAPTYMIADGYCMSFMLEPQVVTVSAERKSSTQDSLLQRTYAVAGVSRHQDYSGSLAIVELEHPIDGMTPLSISRSLTREYHVTDESWEVVSMDNVFASARADERMVAKKSIVRLPATTCNLYHYEEIPFALCLALGSERDRQEVFGFSQGFVLHDSKLIALPQCYSSICSSGLFQVASFLAAKEDWIREQTHDTALWDLEPLETANISHDGVDTEDNILPKASAYAVLLDTSSSSDSSSTPVCNGMLIAPTFVLTTASCVVHAAISHVRLGLDKHISKDDREESTMGVRAIHIHPGFGNTSSEEVGDLALIELRGMAFFLPILLEQDDTLEAQNDTTGRLSMEDRAATDAAATNYSWPLALAPFDASILCASQEPTSDLTSSHAPSADSSAPPENIVNCSFVETPGGELQGNGLVAAFPEGSSLLGIALKSCVSGQNSETTGTCSGSSGVASRDPDSCYARVASPSARAFIDSVSVGHTWRVTWNAHEFNAGRFSPKGLVTEQQTSAETIAPEDPGYTGSLQYDQLPSNTQVGFVVGLRKDKSGQNFCGGSLIASSYVLTAAHCVLGGEANYVSVGSHASAGTETELIPVKEGKVIVHPLYGKRSGISYDVAILELESQAYPAPVQLDNTLTYDASTQFTLYGYGANSAQSQSLSPVLRAVGLPYFDRVSCAKYFPELDDSMLCAGGEPARDACTGDSGSPLVYYLSGKPVLVGVVSTGRNGCGTPGVPGIYGYVSAMQSFISSYVAGYSWLDPSKKVASLESAAKSSMGTKSSPTPQSSTSLRTSLDENEDGVPFEIIHSASGADEHQLSVVKLATDTLPLLQDAVEDFLLGGYTMIGGTWERMSKEIKASDTSITFYSSGEMLDIMKTIAKYSAKPLYQRENRFGTRSANSTSCCNSNT